MKRFLALILAAVMVFSMTACGGEKTYTKDDLAIRDIETGKLIRLGDSREWIERLIGKPEETSYEGDEAVVCKYPSDITISYNKDGEAFDITCFGSDYKEKEKRYELVKGVRFGQTQEDIFKAYPEAKKWGDDTFVLILLKNEDDKKYKESRNFDGDTETSDGMMLTVLCDQFDDNKITFFSVISHENDKEK